MSRAFVKEQDVDTVEHLPDRPVSEHPNLVTEKGMAEIDTALAEARVAYAAAQASSDRALIAAAAREIRYWSARRASAQLVPASGDTSEVRFGATVTIVRDDGREQTFRIVGEDEADPGKRFNFVRLTPCKGDARESRRRRYHGRKRRSGNHVHCLTTGRLPRNSSGKRQIEMCLNKTARSADGSNSGCSTRLYLIRMRCDRGVRWLSLANARSSWCR